MLPVVDKLAGGTIPGPGNYTAVEFNEAVKRDLLSTVLLTGQTADGSNYLQLCEAISRIAITGCMYEETSFSSNNYVLQTAGYTGAIDPLVTPPLPQNYNGPSGTIGSELIIFQCQTTSLVGTNITIDIAQLGITGAQVLAPNYTAGGGFRNLDQAEDFKVDEYAVLRYDGANFIVVSMLSADVFRQATETVIGSLRVATSAQVIAGTDDTTAITPLKLSNKTIGSSIKIENATVTSNIILGNSFFPLDNSIPQITEGNQFISIPFTPLEASSLLKIDCLVTFSISGAPPNIIVALFRDANADAIAATTYSAGDDNGQMQQIYITCFVPASSVSATTFSARIGDPQNEGYEINGIGGAGVFGGVCQTNITVTEIKQ